MTARLLILGSGGQLARALRERAAPAGFEARCAGRGEADLAARGAVAALIEATEPDAVINAAAHTDVDGAESDPARAFAINADGAGEAAMAAERIGARFVHVSTDYVFTTGGPHDEDAAPEPANAYGRSKLAGEHAVLAACPQAAIVRASGIFSGGGRDFPSSMWRLAHGAAPIRVVDDQQVTPIWADALAERLLALALRPEASGLFHAVTPGASWFEVAEAALETLAQAGGPHRAAEPVPSTAFPRPAPRPSDSRLAGARLADATGLPAPDWRDGLGPALQRWLAEHRQAGG
jgi:dTDP-4-dehydrorhamnose reductase